MAPYLLFFISFKVKAQEKSSTEKFSSNVTVVIKLSNVNDNKPKFKNSTYSYEFKDKVPMGSVIGIVQVYNSY